MKTRKLNYETPNIIAAKANRQKMRRNDKCPCGSGKKYKKCCLAKR